MNVTKCLLAFFIFFGLPVVSLMRWLKIPIRGQDEGSWLGIAFFAGIPSFIAVVLLGWWLVSHVAISLR